MNPQDLQTGLITAHHAVYIHSVRLQVCHRQNAVAQKLRSGLEPSKRLCYRFHKMKHKTHRVKNNRGTRMDCSS